MRGAEIESKINELAAQRARCVTTIDKKVLSAYDRVSQYRAPRAIAPVVNENCGGCYIKVTAQTINEIKMYKDLIVCEACGRILYIEEDI